ncbi:MAG TPA: glycosyltransferase family 1 protein [Cellulomonas sp.]
MSTTSPSGTTGPDGADGTGSSPQAPAARAALLQRLTAAAEALDLVPPPDAGDPMALLDLLVRHARSQGGTDVVWLLLVALGGTYPDDALVRQATRRLDLDTVAEAALWLLTEALVRLRQARMSTAEIEIVRGGTLVDVDFSARHNLNTGIQRVVRSAVPRWVADHDPVLVAWTAQGTTRTLTPVERGRVIAWSGPVEAPRQPETAAQRLIVPWRSVLVLPEVPAPHLCGMLAALAEHSGNAVTMVGYDAIPVVSADLMPPAEPNRFVRYLTIVKHAYRVSGISATAAAEYRGFARMLPAQGLPGPDVTECLLPVDVPAAGTHAGATAATALPLVLVVGSHEPRKNHLAVLHAAERLWREGLEFRLRFIGGSSWASKDFDRTVRRLRRAGRPVTIGRSVGDTDLWDSYRTARFTVFPSLHEGYGLPIAESLAVGTPAITSDFGSTAEISRDGGTLPVDPRDDEALLEAMRRLLQDDALLAELGAQARRRPVRSWDDYAAELWDQLVATVEVDR